MDLFRVALTIFSGPRSWLRFARSRAAQKLAVPAAQPFNLARAFIFRTDDRRIRRQRLREMEAVKDGPTNLSIATLPLEVTRSKNRS